MPIRCSSRSSFCQLQYFTGGASFFQPLSEKSQTPGQGGILCTSPTPNDNAGQGGISSLTPFDKGGQGGILCTSLTPNDNAGQAGILLHHLWQRGLLERQLHPTGTAQLELYHLLPPLRLYAEQSTPIPAEILPRFAHIYGNLISWIFAEINTDPAASLLARLSAPDLERALEHSQDLERASYNRCLGAIEFRLGHPWKGKPRLEQALAWARDRDQQLAAHTLSELGLIYKSTGQPQEALKYYQESLQIDQQTGNRAGEAINLTNIGEVYRAIGQPQAALKYYRAALPIRQEVGDRAGEATTLNNIGTVYHAIGQPQAALKYYREALPILKEVGDHAGQAGVLNNIGEMYRTINQPQEALKYYRAALPLRRKVGDRAGEAINLNNIGIVYSAMGQPHEALKYYRAALPIRREVGDRAGEATTLHNMAVLLFNEGENRQALELFWQILSIDRETGAVAGEATTLYALATLLGTRLNDSAQALPLLRHSIELLKTSHLPQDSSGTTLAQHEALLAELERQIRPGKISRRNKYKHT